MCRTFLTAGRMALPEEPGERGGTPHFVNLGDATSVVRRRWGRGGLGLEWASMPFGIPSRTTGTMLSHVLLDRAADLMGWEGIATRLCAVPIYGFRWRGGDGWTRVRAGWALGFFEDGERSGFLLTAVELDGRRAPLVADWDDTRRWLMSESWDQMRLLRAIADGAGANADARYVQVGTAAAS